MTVFARIDVRMFEGIRLGLEREVSRSHLPGLPSRYTARINPKQPELLISLLPDTETIETEGNEQSLVESLTNLWTAPASHCVLV